MANSNTFNELALERIAKCPIMVTEDLTDVEFCGYLLAERVLRHEFEGERASLEDIRKDFTFLWNAAWFPGVDYKTWKAPPMKAGSLYWKGINAGRTISYRLYSLLLDYEVLHPEQPYNLILNGYTIQGKYTLLRKKKGAKIPNVLMLYMNAPAIQHDQAIPPIVTLLCRYVDVKMTETYHEVHVLHYPLLRGKAWTNRLLNEVLAKKWICSMLEVAKLKPDFPTMGEHCKDCSTKPCMEVFNLGRQNDHNWH